MTTIAESAAARAPAGTERFWLIAIAASAGGIPALQTVLAALPATIPAAVVIVQHRPIGTTSVLDRILSRVTPMQVASPMYGDRIRPGHVYLASPNLHLTVQPTGRFSYVDGTRIRGLRSAANPLFESAAAVFRDRTIAVVLTGSGTDATDGVQHVKSAGGIVIVQDPATAAFTGMPRAALRTGAVDMVLPLEAIGPALVALANAPPPVAGHVP